MTAITSTSCQSTLRHQSIIQFTLTSRFRARFLFNAMNNISQLSSNYILKTSFIKSCDAEINHKNVLSSPCRPGPGARLVLIKASKLNCESNLECNFYCWVYSFCCVKLEKKYSYDSCSIIFLFIQTFMWGVNILLAPLGSFSGFFSYPIPQPYRRVLDITCISVLNDKMIHIIQLIQHIVDKSHHWKQNAIQFKSLN